jgi:hypothetical protein
VKKKQTYKDVQLQADGGWNNKNTCKKIMVDGSGLRRETAATKPTWWEATAALGNGIAERGAVATPRKRRETARQRREKGLEYWIWMDRGGPVECGGEN